MRYRSRLASGLVLTCFTLVSGRADAAPPTERQKQIRENEKKHKQLERKIKNRETDIKDLERVIPGWELTPYGRKRLANQKAAVEKERQQRDNATRGSTRPDARRSYTSSPSSRSSGLLAPTPPVVEPESPPQDLSEAWSFSSPGAATPSPAYVDLRMPASTLSINPVGYYQGVTLGVEQELPAVATAQAPTGGAVLTWAGFQKDEKGGRVFFRLTGVMNHRVEQSGRTVRIRFENTKVEQKNNQRDLDLRFFPTPAESVRFSRRGKDTVAVLTLREDAKVEARPEKGPNGATTLVLVFVDTPG